MDFPAIVLTVVVALVACHYLSFMTLLDVRDGIIRMSQAYSFRRFAEFYDTVEDWYAGYDLFEQPRLTNVEYLQAFQQYDVETAYREYRQIIRESLRRSVRLCIIYVTVLFLVGSFLFAIPLLGFAVVLGRYAWGLVSAIVVPRKRQVARLMSRIEFVRMACNYAYGPKETARLLERQPNAQGDDEDEFTVMPIKFSQALMQRVGEINTSLWGEKRWVMTLCVWFFTLVTLSMLTNFVNHAGLENVVASLALMCLFFPAGYLAYIVQTSGVAETEPVVVDEVVETLDGEGAPEGGTSDDVGVKGGRP